MTPFGFHRNDEVATFVRRGTRVTVVWAAKKDGYLWHATDDGIHAVCSHAIVVDLGRDPYPSTLNRSNDLMTCQNCQDRVARVPKTEKP